MPVSAQVEPTLDARARQRVDEREPEREHLERSHPENHRRAAQRGHLATGAVIHRVRHPQHPACEHGVAAHPLDEMTEIASRVLAEPKHLERDARRGRQFAGRRTLNDVTRPVLLHALRVLGSRTLTTTLSSRSRRSFSPGSSPVPTLGFVARRCHPALGGGRRSAGAEGGSSSLSGPSVAHLPRAAPTGIQESASRLGYATDRSVRQPPACGWDLTNADDAAGSSPVSTHVARSARPLQLCRGTA